MIEMKTHGPPLTEADIERVERSLGIRLPEDYRAFLLKVNGGRPGKKNVVFPWKKSRSSLMVLYGIYKEGVPHSVEAGDVFDLEDEARTGWSDMLSIPETLIPIGHDPGGNMICLGVAGNERGRVYYRDNERVPGEPPTKEWTRMKGIYRIADSFTEFLASLRPREP